MCELNADDFQRFIEQFDKSHTEPRPRVFVAGASYYEEAKKLFNDSGIKVVRSQIVEPKGKTIYFKRLTSKDSTR